MTLLARRIVVNIEREGEVSQKNDDDAKWLFDRL